MVTPLGWGRETTWRRLCAGECGIVRRQVGSRNWCVGVVPDGPDGSVPNAARRSAFLLATASEALKDAQLQHGALSQRRVAIVTGASKCDVHQFASFHQQLRTGHHTDAPLTTSEKCLDRHSSHSAWENLLISAPAATLAKNLHLSGPAITLSTACAAGCHAIIEGANLIREGRADIALAGAMEACLHELVLAAYDNMGVLATCGGDGMAFCRPFDRRRSGFVPSEGAAMLVLEDAGAAARRGASPYALVLAGISSADATHLTQFRDDGRTIAAAILRALKQADVPPEAVDYVNAHGTGTVHNDLVETRALKAAFGGHAYRLAISSVKGALGHLLGAAGAVEAALCAMAIREEFIPPTIHLEAPDPQCDLDYVAGRGRIQRIRNAVSLSFGFGGQIGVLVLSRNAAHLHGGSVE